MLEFLKTLMARLSEAWARLTMPQRVILAGAAVVSLAGLILLLTWPSGEVRTGGARDDGYAVLFRGVEPAEASQVVDGLKSAKVPYKLANDGRDILVPHEQLDEQRMAFAAQGLPKSGTIGYEIFDKTNLGVTDFVQNLNYRRALEGEIARTISSISEVENARVHISIPKPTLFTEKEVAPTASIVLKMKGGAQLDRKTVKGIAQLLASSVEGMKAAQVTILDQDGKVLNRGGDDASQLSEANQEIRAQVEGYLKAKVSEILDGVVGPGAHRVQVTAELDFEQVEKTMETFKPESKVVRSEQTEEETKTGSPTDGDVTRETRTANYEIDRTVMKVISQPGSTRKRVSVSVAVDGHWETDSAGKPVWKARTPEEVAQLTELVRSAVGAVPANEDVVYVTNVRFDNPAVQTAVQEMEEASNRKRSVPWSDWVRYGVIALVVVAAFLFIRSLAKMLLEAINPPAPSYAELQMRMQEQGPAADVVRVNDLLQRIESQTRADPVSYSKLIRSWLQEGSNSDKMGKKGR